MIDRIVHHADVLTLKGASYRLRNRGIDTLPSIRTQDPADVVGSRSWPTGPRSAAPGSVEAPQSISQGTSYAIR